MAFAVGLASVGAVFGDVPDLAVEGWHANPRLPSLLGFPVVAAASPLVVGTVMCWMRNGLLARRGTAYVVQDRAVGWEVENRAGS